jgi:dTDP-4-dehydrorhamnose reductase
MKVLLLGANGQVGWELQRALAPLGDVTACDFDTPAPHTADFSRPDSLVALVQAVRPGLIVNAAAHTAVDKAESEPELVRSINATAPGVLAQQVRALDALLVHYSTDYVFDGSGSTPRDETAEPRPLSVYGRTKLAGEQAIAASGCRHLILRTSWVYAARGGNFARTMLRLAQERDELRVIDDQIGAPTGADLLADVTAHAVRAIQHDPALCGLYHCTAAGQTSWHGYARLVIEHAREHGQPIRVAPEAIRPIATNDYPTPARRPLNSRLDCTRLATTFGLTLPPWEQGVRRMLTEILSR